MSHVSRHAFLGLFRNNAESGFKIVNGNGYYFDGQGEQYWDGLGSSGSTKPHPMMKYTT